MIYFVLVQGLVLMNSAQQDMLSRPGFVAVQHLVDLNCKILPLPQQITRDQDGTMKLWHLN